MYQHMWKINSLAFFLLSAQPLHNSEGSERKLHDTVARFASYALDVQLFLEIRMLCLSRTLDPQ